MLFNYHPVLMYKNHNGKTYIIMKIYWNETRYTRGTFEFWPPCFLRGSPHQWLIKKVFFRIFFKHEKSKRNKWSFAYLWKYIYSTIKSFLNVKMNKNGGFINNLVQQLAADNSNSVKNSACNFYLKQKIKILPYSEGFFAQYSLL